MTPTRCISGPEEEGDCFRACMAAILNISAARVPHFAWDAPTSEVFHKRINAWLETYGLRIAVTMYEGHLPAHEIPRYVDNTSHGVPAIMSGSSATGGGHSIVIMDGEIVCDPSGAGIAGPLETEIGEVYLVIFVAAGPNFVLREIED